MIRRIGILTGGVVLALAAIWGGTGGGFFATAAPEAEGWIGSPLDQHAKLVDSDQCLGGIDLEQQDPNESSKTVISGWAWDVQAKALPQAILIVDASSIITGYSEPGLPRSDVSKVLPEVASEDAGWSSAVEGEAGQMVAYALLSTDEACPLGRAQ